MSVVWAVSCYPHDWPIALRPVLGGICVRFRGSVLFCYKHFLCPIQVGFAMVLTHWFHAFFNDYLPFPLPCHENIWTQCLFLYLLLFVSFGLLLSLINSFMVLFSFLLEKGWNNSRLPYHPQCSSLNLCRPFSPSTSGAVGLWPAEAGFRGGWVPLVKDSLAESSTSQSTSTKPFYLINCHS